MQGQNFFTKLNKGEKKIFYLTLLIVLISFLDRLVLGPIVEKIKTFEEEITSAEIEIKKNSGIMAQSERITREEKKFSAYAVQALSDDEEKTSLLKAIESLASAAAVYLVDVKPSGIKVEGPVKSFMVNVSCEAKMDQLISFMYAIENADMLLQVGAFNLSLKSKSSDVLRCELLIYKIVMP